MVCPCLRVWTVTIIMTWSPTSSRRRYFATSAKLYLSVKHRSVRWFALLQQLFKKMAASGAPAARASLESGAFTFHYIIDSDVCYLTLVERSYPKKLAYQYLEELQREFFSLYGREIEQARRPYAFIKFGQHTSRHVMQDQLVYV